MTATQILLIMIVLPAVIALLIGIIPKKQYAIQSILLLAATVVNLIYSIILFGNELIDVIPWAGFGINLAIRLDSMSCFIVLATAGFGLLIGLYSIAFLRKKPYYKLFYFYYLITLAMVNGAVLADNLVMMLFFWEGILVTIFGFILVTGRDKSPTAVKALVLNGTADLSLMLGIAITAYLSGTMIMSDIVPIAVDSSVAVLGFVTIMLGAIGKAGAMPFHTWIPDSAIDAPLPFMAFLPAALDKLLGIYLLARIVLSLYQIEPGSSMSILMMTLGAITIVLAVFMALIQKDYKRLLSYHAVSQVGYMVLGIGTALPVGIVGGLFHMINHAIYKSGLFLTAGAVERQTGTTDLREISGLGRKMPITGLCFIVLAAAISGVPPINGFFSKELVFDAALEIGKESSSFWGMSFYIAAAGGALLTAASFLKLGHAAYFGKLRAPQVNKVREAPGAMLLPMVILALTCILFGVYNPLPLRGLIQPSLGTALAGHDYSGLPHNWTLVIISLIVLGLAVLNHYFGYKRSGSGLGASDHIHYAPGLHFIYDRAEEHYFDPFDIIMVVVKGFSWISFGIDRAINWIYDVFFVRIHHTTAKLISEMNNGTPSRYLVWSFSGLAIIIFIFVAIF